LCLGDTLLELFGVGRLRGIMVSEVNDIVGYKHICLSVDSVEQEHQRLAKLGVNFPIAPRTVQGAIRVDFLKGSDGMDVELVECLR
jgi:hypothetical protein